MSADNNPIVNGCYLDVGGEMFKVRMLDYEAGALSRVVCEDTLGKIHRITIDQWRKIRLIPVCLSWQPEPNYVCYESEDSARSTALVR